MWTGIVVRGLGWAATTLAGVAISQAQQDAITKALEAVVAAVPVIVAIWHSYKTRKAA